MPWDVQDSTFISLKGILGQLGTRCGSTGHVCTVSVPTLQSDNVLRSRPACSSGNKRGWTLLVAYAEAMSRDNAAGNVTL